MTMKFGYYMPNGYLGKDVCKCSRTEQLFELLEVILDDVIIRFRQKMLQSDRLVDTFDLIYDTTIYGQKSNLTPI